MKMPRWIPNLLTVLRLLSIVFVISHAVRGQWLAALIWAIGGFLTDFVDGALARRFDAITVFGKIMDPIADVLFDVGLILGTTLTGITGWWLAIGLMTGAVMLRLPAYFGPDNIWYKLGFISGWFYGPPMIWYVVKEYFIRGFGERIWILILIFPIVLFIAWLKRDRMRSDWKKFLAVVWKK